MRRAGRIVVATSAGLFLLTGAAAIVLPSLVRDGDRSGSGRSEAATVGLLRHAHMALGTYRSACGGYPTSLAAALRPSACLSAARLDPIRQDPQDPLARAAAGETVFNFRWTYDSCSTAQTPCATYSIRASYVAPDPPVGTRYEFVASPDRLNWKQRTLFGWRRQNELQW
jgi:hypothetical protein